MMGFHFGQRDHVIRLQYGSRKIDTLERAKTTAIAPPSDLFIVEIGKIQTCVLKRFADS